MLNTPLTPAEGAHLSAFRSARPQWRVVALHDRLMDEDTGRREHKYAKAHPYITGMKFVMDKVRAMAPCTVLDIGSPLAQNVALACLPGVDVTVLDVRPNEDAEMLGLKWARASATEIPFPDGSQKIITSLWVMGHVGDGRYGDALDADGDRRMLREIARVLAPGGMLILGPGLLDSQCGNIFNLHRIYSWEWLRAEFAATGLAVLETHDLFVSSDVFIKNDGPVADDRRDGLYGLAVLTK